MKGAAAMIKSLKFAGLLIFALLLSPALAHAAGQDTSGLTLDARVGLRAYTALVETHLADILDGAQSLAATGDIQSGDWSRMKGPLAVYAKGISSAAAVWFVRPDGSYYTVEKGLTDRTVKDRDYFPRLMAGGNVEGILVVSRSTGRKSVVVATPVSKDGRVIGALGVSVNVEKLAGWIDATLNLPPNYVFYALDAQGRTALHRESALIFDIPARQGSETLSVAVTTMLSRSQGAVRYRFRDHARLVIFQRSKPTGWVFVIGGPDAAVAP